MKLGQWALAQLDVGEIDTALGRALTEERYKTLRQQVPIIYLLAAANLFGLQLATVGKLIVGVNLPTFVSVCALVRVLQWRPPHEEVSPRTMMARMRQTSWLAALICFSVAIWCVYLLESSPPEAYMAIVSFGGLTAIGVAYGLSYHPIAARLPLVFLALPVAAMALLHDDGRLAGAALSLALVAVLIWRLLSVQHAQFVDLIRSRFVIASQQEQTEQAKREAIESATTDFLTGLANRRAFVTALDAQIEKTRTAGAFAVAIVDLDGFKAINDTFGHATGDKLLETVARRLVQAAGSDALVARLGGDEFGILFYKLAQRSKARKIGTELIANVNRPVKIEKRQFPLSACCGFGIFRRGRTRTSSRILADADFALYEAKKLPSGGVAVFEPRMEEPYRRRVQIERALRLPGVEKKISLVFQPIVDLRSGQVLAHEALARWNDDELGRISPAEFVPIAERLNLIGEISDYLMRKAFAEAAHWPSALHLSFNLSAVQLSSPGSAEKILIATDQTGLTPQRLQVEVTETALMANFSQARRNIDILRKAGVTIVLDDFGAGFASIGYLREMHFDQIKLDGTLVTAAEDDSDSQKLLAAVIGLCSALEVKVIAEHVETEQQLALLLKLGCTSGQGFWLHAPMSAEEVRSVSDSASLIFGRLTADRQGPASGNVTPIGETCADGSKA